MSEIGLSRIKFYRTGAYLFLLTIIFYWPVFANIPLLARGDWDLAFFNNAVPFISLKEYHQFPLWNPFYCAGVSYIGSPDNTFFSISTFFILLTNNVVLGTKLSVLFHVFFALWGMYTLCQYLQLGFLSSLTSGLIFVFNGCLTSHIGEGPLDWYSICFLPWIFLCYLRSLDQNRFCALTGILISLMFYDRGGYTFFYTLLFLGIYALSLAFLTKKILPIFRLLTAVAFALGLSAPRLLPILTTMTAFPRLTSPGAAPDFSILFGSLLMKNPLPYAHNFFENTGWWEFNLYAGVIPVGLFLLSFFHRGHAPLKIAAVILFILALGNLGPWAPWTLLHKLPVFKMFQIPTRIFLIFYFLLALLVCVVLSKIEKKSLWRYQTIIFSIFCLIFFDLLTYTRFILEQTPRPFIIKEQYHQEEAFAQIQMTPHAQFKYGAWSNMFESIWWKKGVVNGYFSVPLPRSAKTMGENDYRGEFFLENGHGDVTLKKWSPNHLVFEYKVTGEDQLTINQNFDKGWKSSEKFSIINRSGLLSIPLKSGKGILSLCYLPLSFLAGIAIAITTTIGIIFVAIWRGSP